MKIVILGCPGAGKGTQATILCAKYGFKHISTGDLFRLEIAAKTALGQKVTNYLRNGTLVPDEVVVDMVAGKLDKADAKGCVLDGFPRTLEQAQALDKYLKKNGQQIDLVLFINLDEGEVLRRLTSRRNCIGCGAVYNLATKPPKAEGKCDLCGGDIIQREDDQETTVKKRLMVFDDLTAPLIAFYRSETSLHEVDGSRPIEEVTQNLASIIDQAQAGQA
jgi:adenylate kinase